MSGFLVWLLDQSGSKILDRLLVGIKGDPLSNELHEAIEKWRIKLPENAALVSTDALFANRKINNGSVSLPCLQKVRSSFEARKVPEVKEMKDALLEQWLDVRKNIPDRQPFFNLERGEVDGHLSELAVSLVSTCSNNDGLFKVTTITLLREIKEHVVGENVHLKSSDEIPKLLSDDQKKLILRVRQYDGRCGVWATKGEEECLWVPGPIMNMQWGYERTPKEVEISGKDKGCRSSRLSWIDVVYTLKEMEILAPLPEDACVFELTEFGWHVAKKLHDLGDGDAESHA